MVFMSEIATPVLLKCCLSFILIDLCTGISAQSAGNFPSPYQGEWQGVMFLYHHGELNDSIPVRFTIAKMKSDTVYRWAMEYLSPKPIIKDYRLVYSNDTPNVFNIDEQNGIVIPAYWYEPGLYSMFQVNDIWLTASYIFVDDKIHFEVTSGKEGAMKGDVRSYSIDYVQRAVLYRTKNQSSGN